MYELHARPSPRPGPSFPRRLFHPDPSTTFLMHVPSPMLPTRRKLAVSEFGGWSVFNRSSAGSIPRSHAILSIWTSSANRGWGVPWPRFGPHGGLFVKTRTPSNLYFGTLYVTVW